MTSNVVRPLIGGKRFDIETFGPDDPFTNAVGDGYGSELYRFCRANVAPGAVAIDIGANIGLTACVLSQVARRVIALEPGPAVFPKLQRNLRTNGLVDSDAFQIAVGAGPGQVRFGGQSAYGHVVVDQVSPLVEVDSLDNLVERFELDRLDFIKIDVEGFEPQVLAGAAKTINRFDPLIFMEFNSWCLMDVSGKNPLEFAKELAEAFETMAVIEPSTGRFAPVDPRGLVSRNITRSGAVDDVVLSARARVLVQPDGEPHPAPDTAAPRAPDAPAAGSPQAAPSLISRLVRRFGIRPGRLT